MKKHENVEKLKNEIKQLKDELKETKEILKIITNNALKWKNKYDEIKRDYSNLIKEKQIFINTRPEKIVNVEIKGDVFFKPSNNFYTKDFLDDLNILDIDEEINTSRKKPIGKKPALTKKEIDLINRYEEINQDESSSLMQPLNISSNASHVSLQYYTQEEGNNENDKSIDLDESYKNLKKKRKRRKKY